MEDTARHYQPDVRLSLHSDSEDATESVPRKRKARAPKACFPCRQRKVKCSYETPCGTCVIREHPEICVYDPSAKRLNLGIAGQQGSVQDGTVWTPSKEEWDGVCSKLSTMEQSILDLRRDIRRLVALHTSESDNRLAADGNLSPHADSSSIPPDSPKGILLNPDFNGGESVHLGCNSVPAMVVALNSNGDADTVQELLEKSILPVFGLDNESATYPFVDLWGLPHDSIIRVEQLYKLLPSNSDCLHFFRNYRDQAHVLYPSIVDIEEFESDLTAFLAVRANNDSQFQKGYLADQKIHGKTMHWIGLLFAALASGCQCSDNGRKERQLTSQVYVCCAYECLRIINYLSHSTLDDIQNLLVIGNVLSNNMNAGVAWSLLGLTIRLAQSHGLHYPSPSSAPVSLKSTRHDIWWQIIWQDSLLSITYDRATSTGILTQHDPIELVGAAKKMSYTECMRALCKIGLDIVRERTLTKGIHHRFLRIVECRDKITSIMDKATNHLRDVNICRSIKDQLEYWNLYLHRSYITAELCRPAIVISNKHVELTTSLRSTCIQSLADTVEAFLGLQNITRFASQSWAAVHRSLSSALLLGILKEPLRSHDTRRLIEKLISVLSDITSSVQSSEVSGPISRSLVALQKLASRHPTVPQQVSMSEPGSSSALDTDYLEMSSASSSPSFLQNNADWSPYSVVNNILWGKGSGMLHSGTFM